MGTWPAMASSLHRHRVPPLMVMLRSRRGPAPGMALATRTAWRYARGPRRRSPDDRVNRRGYCYWQKEPNYYTHTSHITHTTYDTISPISRHATARSPLSAPSLRSAHSDSSRPTSPCAQPTSYCHLRGAPPAPLLLSLSLSLRHAHPLHKPSATVAASHKPRPCSRSPSLLTVPSPRRARTIARASDLASSPQTACSRAAQCTAPPCHA